MAKSSNIYIRVEPDLKEQAEKVFNELGISMSNAVGLFLKQVVINQAIPFELKLAPAKIKSVDTLTEAEFNAEIEKGYADYLANKGRPVKEVFSDIRKGLNV
ncbi:type II toxin-antitoxin system RelB/DinJ family antitoxin [Thermincola potens]|uniref:Addiction module antitoxin, RelB/DinJ family n=1 Tax=Thermincola potens (strain JR) TaxID=635013 RepID=D5XF90_THEPJ|nr:type II toxin-antitoxin system RelB/DinJ family antitoxin [Thermincola potens]ADG82311.1 addiction module antitoxin, RelB/DinJ family [Thermincola potens JR]